MIKKTPRNILIPLKIKKNTTQLGYSLFSSHQLVSICRSIPPKTVGKNSGTEEKYSKHYGGFIFLARHLHTIFPSIPYAGHCLYGTMISPHYDLQQKVPSVCGVALYCTTG